MCEACWVEYGRSKDLPENWEEIVALIWGLYELEPTGGPLHVMLDDFNIEGEWKPYLSEAWPVLDAARLLSNQICDLMNPLTISQRAAVVARWEGWF